MPEGIQETTWDKLIGNLHNLKEPTNPAISYICNKWYPEPKGAQIADAYMRTMPQWVNNWSAAIFLEISRTILLGIIWSP